MDTHAAYVALIPLLPLAGAVVLTLGGAALQRRFGERPIGWIACSTVAASFVLSMAAFGQLLGMEPEHRYLLADLFRWFDLYPLKANVAFAVDPLSAVMILVVTGIGGLIHVYSTGYMHGDQGVWRFFAYLNLFTFAMLTLVLADNLLLMFVGWEGVGFCSWGLIGFWHKEMANARAGNKAFIVNRIGDFGFVLGMFLLFWALDEHQVATLTFRDLAKHAHLLDGMTFWGWPVATLVTLLLFVGATGKSAQIPLYVWLPDAMAGPTPVSALIHAATMVTAGVYMIGRTNFLFSMAPATLTVVATVGMATALLAATIGTAQNDIKKVLAYSTVSQLGFMFLAMGVGAYAAGIFHLMTHAFFKACLFLGSGSVIHAMGGEQDMRKMGGLRAHLPATSFTFIVATLAICGIPPLAGFFSKDEILWQALSSPHGSAFLHFGGLVAAGFTAFYMFRQVFMVFFGECRADEHTKHHLHESPPSITVPLWILAGGAAVMGLLWIPNVWTPFEHWLAPVMGMHPDVAPALAAAHEAHEDFALEIALMALSVAVAGIGIAVAYLMYYRKAIPPDAVAGLARGSIYRTVFNKYWVDEVYELVFVRGLAIGGARVLAWFDTHVIDGLVDGAAAVGRGVGWFIGIFDDGVVDGAVNGVADGAYVAGRSLRRLQSGAITAYLYVIAIGVLGGVFLYWSMAAAS